MHIFMFTIVVGQFDLQAASLLLHLNLTFLIRRYSWSLYLMWMYSSVISFKLHIELIWGWVWVRRYHCRYGSQCREDCRNLVLQFHVFSSRSASSGLPRHRQHLVVGHFTPPSRGKAALASTIDVPWLSKKREFILCQGSSTFHLRESSKGSELKNCVGWYASIPNGLPFNSSKA